jgi:hypothetical protein
MLIKVSSSFISMEQCLSNKESPDRLQHLSMLDAIIACLLFPFQARSRIALRFASLRFYSARLT